MSFLNKISPYIEIIHPFKFKDFITKNKDTKGLKPSFFNVAIATVISILFSILQNTVLKKALQENFPTDPTQALSAQQFLALLNNVLSPEFIILNFFIAVVSFYALIYSFYLIIKLLGGKGNFNSHAYLLSVLYVSFTIVSLILTLVFFFYNSHQPDIFTAVLGFLILISIFYVLYNIVQLLHDLSWYKVIIALICFVVVTFIFTSALERAFLNLLLSV